MERLKTHVLDFAGDKERGYLWMDKANRTMLRNSSTLKQGVIFTRLTEPALPSFVVLDFSVAFSLSQFTEAEVELSHVLICL